MATWEQEKAWAAQVNAQKAAQWERDKAWTAQEDAKKAAQWEKDKAWNLELEDGGGPGTHLVGSYFDPIKGRTVNQYAAGDANTSFWGKVGGVLSDVAKVGGAIAAPFTGGTSLLATAGLGGVESAINAVKGSDVYKAGSSIYDTGKNVYSQFVPKPSAPVARPGVTPIPNLPSNLVTPQLSNQGPAPVNNFSNPSQSYIEKNYGMAILGAGLVVMFFMFKKGRK